MSKRFVFVLSFPVLGPVCICKVELLLLKTMIKSFILQETVPCIREAKISTVIILEQASEHIAQLKKTQREQVIFLLYKYYGAFKSIIRGEMSL